MRRALTFDEIIPRGGVNQQPELASKSQLETALDAWAPSGLCTMRPGSTGLFGFWDDEDTAGIYLGQKLKLEDSGGTFSDVTSTEIIQGADGEWWYWGTSEDWSLYPRTEFRIVSAAHTDDCYFSASYWNGSAWVPLLMQETLGADDGFTTAVRHMRRGTSSQQNGFTYARPPDLAQTTVDGDNLYWIKFMICGDSLSATTLDLESTTAYNVGPDVYMNVVFQSSIEKRYLSIWNSTNKTNLMNADGLGHFNGVHFQHTTRLVPDHLPTWAFVPEVGEAYVAFGRKVFVLSDSPASTDNIYATVEDRDFAVGDKAPYDSAYIAQRSEFPAAKFITFYNGRLWAANLDTSPTDIVWSAAQPYYKVWPLLSVEPVMEDDNSPITGISGLGEHLVVFKQDSIWIMVSTGIDSFGLSTFVPTRVVAGVGTVSHHSVAKIRGNLVFLTEDGVYRFDGTPNVVKVSEDNNGGDRLADFWNDVTRSQRHNAVGVHWRTKTCYLLALSVGGSETNNRVLCWDYKNDTWWIWKLNVKVWTLDEDSNDDERLYYTDHNGAVFELSGARTDHHAQITPDIITHRIGYGENVTRTVRQVEINGFNTTVSLTVDVIPDDDDANADSGTITMTDVLETTEYIPRRRRKRLNFRTTCDHAQIRLRQTTLNGNFDVSKITVGMKGRGRR